MSEWQTIDTAPYPTVKDARSAPMLVTNGIDVWAATVERWEIRGVSYYWDCHGAVGYDCENEFTDPTHWMPLPTPPSEA